MVPRVSAPSPMTPDSAALGIGWPAVMTGRAATLHGLLTQLGDSQWWSPAQLEQVQFRQLDSLVAFARETIPFYAERLAAAGIQAGRPLDPQTWSRLPILSRAEVRDLGDRLHPSATPPSHGPVTDVSTGGSSGIPIRVRKTDIAQLMWEAVHLRQQQWHRTDFRGTIVNLGRPLQGLSPEARAAESSAAGALLADWGPPARWFWQTGRVATLNASQPLDVQAAFLCRHRPTSLRTIPSRLRLLLKYFQNAGIAAPRIESVWTDAEMVSDALREDCLAVFGARIVDVYSAAEVGLIALQCPTGAHYHIQSEVMRVEVLNEAGQPCRPGEIGRIVVTPLHNFAHPLLRYAIGDEAEVGPPCRCGRGLPVLRRIIGRQAEYLRLPSGERRRPALQHYALARILPIMEFRYVQRSLHMVELMLVVARPLTDAELEQVRTIAQGIGEEFEISITFHPTLPRTAAGKLQMFVCDVPDQPC